MSPHTRLLVRSRVARLGTLVVAAVSTVTGAVILPSAPALATGTVTQTYSYTGSTATFTVPAGVTSLTVTMKGGQGGRGGIDYGTYNFGGYQGVVTGTIAVTPGQEITVAVGGGGAQGAGGGSAPGGAGGQNPLTGYDGATGGTSGPEGSSGGGGGGGGATVLRLDGTDIVAGGAGGNGGNGQFQPIIGRVAEDHHIPRSDTTSTTGRPGMNTITVCSPGFRCDGGASGAGGGGAQGGEQGDVQYGGASATEYFGFGGAPGENSTAGLAGLVSSYDYYSTNSQHGSVTITYEDGKPGAPLNLAATTLTGAVDLAWDAPATAGAFPITDYTIEIATSASGPWTTLDDGVSTDLAFTVTGLTNGTGYWFRVSAINSKGTGAAATTAVATVPSDIPQPPVLDTAVGIANGIVVDFTAGTSDAPILGYQYQLDGGDWVTGSVNASQLTIGGLVNGRTYSVSIRAVNAIGPSAATDTATATPLDVPGAPSGLQAVGADAEASLTWTAPVEDNGSPVTDYVVQYATDVAGPYTTFADGESTGTTATVGGLTNGVAYHLRVGAVNASGTGPWSAVATATPYTVPGAPTLALEPGDGSLTVEITLADDGGSDVTLYEYRVDGGTWRPTGTLSDTFIVSGLTNATAYDIEVRATNAAGTGPASEVASGTPLTVPAAPTVSAVALDTGAVDVAFVLGADGGSPITNVEYSVDGGTNWIVRTPAGTVSPITISGLTGGQTYPVVVRAINATGHSAASNVSSVTAVGAPGAPTVSLAPADTALVVSTTAPANGGSPITGYEYSIDGGVWTAAGTVASPFVIDGLTNGVEYDVRVRAVNAAGDGATSSTVAGTPATTPGVPTIDGDSLVGGEGTIDVAFTPPADDGGTAITTYEYSTDGGATWRSRGAESTASPLVIATLSTDGTTPLDGGTVYPVQIRAVNAIGAGQASASANGVTTTVPGAPVVGSVVANDGTAIVEFTAPANGGTPITGYEYSLDGGAWTTTGSLGTTLVLTGLTNGQSYGVELRAVNGLGAGAASDSEPFVMAAPPAAPALTGLTAGDGTLTAEFTAPSDGGSAITTYEYSTDGGATWRTRSTGTTDSPIVITTESGSGEPLQNATIYTVQVRAVNAAGAGLASDSELAAPRSAPEAPTTPTVTPGDGSLTLTFTLGSDGGSAITELEYRVDGGAWQTAGSIGSPLTITGLTNGTEYDVAVRLRNAIGAGASSATVSGTPSALPGVPTAITGVAHDSRVTVAWSAPASNGGTPIDGYTVSAYTQAAGGSPLATCTTASLTCDVTGLTNGVTVYLEVTAHNAAGTGVASSPRLARTPIDVPTVSIASIGYSTTELAITADVDDDGGSPVTAYQYRLDGGAWTNATTGSPFTIAGLTAGQTYALRIRAVNAAGTGPATAPIDVVPHTAPSAPLSLVATSGQASVSLVWQAPSSNGGQPVTDYVVQYSTSATGPFSTFADGTSSATTATVTGLTNNTPYYFRVAASNLAGSSSWSALAGATPRSAPSAPTINSITAGSRFLTVNFSAPVDNGGAAVTAYQYRLDGGTWTTAAATSSPLMITGLTNGVTYGVQIRAVNSVGGGTASNLVNAKPYGVPAAVVGFRAAPSGTTVTLSWDAVDDNGSAISAYNVIRWSAATEGSISASWQTTSTSLDVTGLSNGTYYFTIEATNVAGTGARTSPRTSAIVGGTVPDAPTPTGVVVDGDEVSASWTAGAANTSPISSYLVQYTLDGSTWTTGSSGSSATSATFDAHTPTAIRIAAVSATGVGAFATVDLPTAGPAVVNGVTDSGADVGGGVDANGLTADVVVELADSVEALGTPDSTEVATDPSSATGSDVTPVSVTLADLQPGHHYVARLKATAAGVTVYGSVTSFATDAIIETTVVTLEYTGEPAVLDTTVVPGDLPVTTTYAGTGDTGYGPTSVAPTDAGTYELTTAPTDEEIGGAETVAFTIDPKPVTVTVDAVDRYYDGSVGVELVLDLDGEIDGDDVLADPDALSGTVATAGVGVDKLVTVTADYGVSLLDGDDASNYDASQAPGDVLVTIARAPQTVGFTSTAPSELTVGQTYVVSATSSLGRTVTFAVGSGSGSVCTLAGSTVTAVATGTCVVVARQAGDADVLPAAHAEQSLTIVAAPVEPEPESDPELNLDLDLEIGATASNAPVHVSGSGLQPFSVVRIEMHSDPVLLGTVITDADGAFSITVYLPAEVPAGDHEVVVIGRSPEGAQVTETADLFIDWSGSIGWVADADGDGDPDPVELSGLTPINPQRVLDTRDGAKPAAGKVVRVTFPAGLLPADVDAVALNVTVTEPSAPGYVTAYPCSSDRPEASMLNHAAGETVANSVVVPVRAGRSVCLYTLASAHLVVDVTGSLSPDGDALTTQTPVRVADTRTATRVRAGTPLRVDVTGAGLAPADASAVALHVAATGAAGEGFLTVYPCGEDRPVASTLNYRAGRTVGNSTYAKVGADGAVCIYSLAATDVVVDLVGWASPTTASSYRPIVPGRILDTRESSGRTRAGSTVRLDVSSIEHGSAVALNVAVVDARSDGFVTVFPCGEQRPLAASVNHHAGQTHGTQVTSGIGDDDTICVYTSSATDLVIDVAGVIVPVTG